MESIEGKGNTGSKRQDVTIPHKEKVHVDSKILVTENRHGESIAEDDRPLTKNLHESKDEKLGHKVFEVENENHLTNLQVETDVIENNNSTSQTLEGKNAPVEGNEVNIENNNCSKRGLLKCGNNNSISKCKGVKFDEKLVTSKSALKVDAKDLKSESKDVKQESRDIPISGKLLRWSIRRDSLPLVSIRNVLLKKRNLSPDSSSWRRRSTGNFAAGSAGGGRDVPRSAPATPLQLEPTTPRNKHDKQAIKPLSGSAVSVRANGTGDATEGKQPSKSRQKKFQRHFPQVGPEEKVLNYYSCALVGDLLLQGHLYITKNYFAFYSNVFGYVTKLLIPTTSVLRITKEKVARIIPNAVGVCTRDERHVFGSLLSRDSTYKLMTHVWKAARAPPELVPPNIKSQDLRASEVELDASEYSPEDDSSSAGDRLDAPDPPPTRTQTDTLIGTGKVGVSAVIQPALLTGSTAPPLKPRSTPYNALLITLGVLLALSASWMCYKLYHTSHHPLQEDLSNLSGSELYSELVRFRARLHGRAANELHTFLSSNLLLLTKVRQSLEALSGVILSDMAHDVPADTVFS